MTSKTKIYKAASNFSASGSLLNKRNTRKCYDVNEEKFDDTDTPMETRSSKSLSQLDVQLGASKSSAQTETKLLKWCPYKIGAIQKFLPLDREAGSQYCRLFQDLGNQCISRSKTHFLSLVWVVPI
jgi:hypothetical protein